MTLVLTLLPYLAAALGLGGWAVPFVVAAITGLTWPGWVKQIIMYAISIIAGGAVWIVSNGWPTGQIDQAELGTLIVGIIGAAHLAYNYLWMNKVAPAVAAARTKLVNKTKTPTAAPLVESDQDVVEPGGDASDNADEKVKPL